MIKQASEKFKAEFLIAFTEELIRNSKTAETISIQKKLREKIKENLEKKENEKELHSFVSKKNFPNKNLNQQISKPFPTQRRINHVPQRISINPLPPTVRNIRPTPTNYEIDLGKLNPFVKDSAVTAIECTGPEKNINVKLGNRIMPTGIKLSEEEINEVIQKFSRASKIPLEEGVFRVAVGGLIMNAIISDVIDTKFIIEKIGFNKF